MPALWIAHVSVTDADAYKKYAELAGPAIAQHGGAFIARGGRYVQLEGRDRPRNVDHARGASERDLVIVETTE